MENQYNKLVNLKREYDWTKLTKMCEMYDIVFIYGYTWISQNLLWRLQKSGIRNVKFFFDRDGQKIGQVYDRVKCVEATEWIAFLREKFLVINCAQKSARAVRIMLYNLGVDEDSIVDYVIKDKNYFRKLDKKCYDRELEQEILTDQSLMREYTELHHASLEKKKQILSCPENYCLYPKLYDRYFLFDWYVNKPLVSIIIPAYNAEKYIDRCLESILEQTYSHWECIIINDGSRDSTEVCIRKWVRRDGRFQSITQENMGMGQARNKGISLASGKYFTFVDADDWVEPSYIEEMLMAALKNNADVCKCNFWYHDVLNDKIFSAEVEEKINPYGIEVYRTPNMWCNLFKRELFEDNQIKMPGIPLEDLAIYPLLLLKAKGIAGVSKPLYHYQINTGSSVMDSIENIMYYPEAITYLLEECERLELRDTYEDLLRDIAWRHMNGSLNSRIKKWLPEEKFEKCRQEWYRFMEKCFPGCLEHYGIRTGH